MQLVLKLLLFTVFLDNIIQHYSCENTLLWTFKTWLTPAYVCASQENQLTPRIHACRWSPIQISINKESSELTPWLTSLDAFPILLLSPPLSHTLTCRAQPPVKAPIGIHKEGVVRFNFDIHFPSSSINLLNPLNTVRTGSGWTTPRPDWRCFMLSFVCPVCHLVSCSF